MFNDTDRIRPVLVSRALDRSQFTRKNRYIA